MDAQQNADALDDQQPVVRARVELGRLLRGWREAGNNRSQGWVARQLNTNQPTVSRWETGATLPDPETIRALWRIYAKSEQSRANDPQLDKALALRQRAEEEGTHVPKQRPTPVSGTPQPHLPSPQPRAGRKRLIAWAAAVIVVLGAAAAWVGIPDADQDKPEGASPSASSSAASVRPAPTVTCDGASCASLEPATTTCSTDATTAYTGYDYGVRVELRYSALCHAAWAKMSGTAAGDRVMVTPKLGNAEEYRQQYGHDAHTRMVPALTPGDARACAIVDGRGTVCATTSPAQR
ncbi:DUF2690 domain-containing protein [Streptomyces sp. NPDC029216]|uniref:DUF2690 domain-containing protein n=1 Tax=Streptomyces sp. NPDC029216 TaxID=3154701 RepID=UPI0033D1BB38